MLGLSRGLWKDRHSPDLTEIAQGTVGMCPVPAGAEGHGWEEELGFTPSTRCSPAASSAGLGRSAPSGRVTSPAFRGASGSSAAAFPARDEKRRSCDAGAETLEACEDARGGGEKQVQVGGLGSHSQLHKRPS